jgi:hypothetical protein
VTLSHTFSSAPASPRRPANARGQPFTSRSSVIAFAQRPHAGRENDFDGADRFRAQSVSPPRTAACQSRTSPGSMVANRFL